MDIANNQMNSSGWAEEFDLPVMDGFDAIFLPRANAQRGCINFVHKMPAAFPVGAPTWSPKWAAFRGAVDFLQTRTQEKRAQTLMIVGKPTGDLLSAATQVMYCSTFTRPVIPGGGTGSTFGCALSHQNPGGGAVIQAIGSRGTSTADHINGQVTLSTPVPGDWRLMAVVVKDETTKNEIFNITTGQHAVSTAANTPRLPTTGFYRIGSSYSLANYLGECLVAFIGIASVALTETNLLKNAACLQKFFQEDTGGIVNT